MNTNVGTKIKTITHVFAWIGYIAYILIGVYLFDTTDEMIGILVGVVGVFFTWVMTIMIQGYGELVINIQGIYDLLDSRKCRDNTLNKNTNTKEDILKLLKEKQLITNDEYENKMIEIAPEHSNIIVMFDALQNAYEDGTITDEDYSERKKNLLKKI